MPTKPAHVLAFPAIVAILLALVAVVAVRSPAEAATATVTPGVQWTDTAGNRLQAHGTGFFKVGSTYYMVGEDKSAGATFTAVACYSSPDLVHWTRQVNALSRQASGDLAAGRIVERPKVIYNSSTSTYVLWVHIDNTSYSDRRAGVATSSTPCGPYTYLGSSHPLGHESRDLGLFKDDDGTAYLMHDDPAGSLRIDRLSGDYTQAASAVASFQELEAPAIAKVAGRYFLVASHLTGWNTNDNVYASATSLSGPWSSFSNVAAAGTSTYNSQSSQLLPVTGSEGTSYLYAGDRWNPGDLNSSLPVWLPITLTSSGTALLSWYPSWGIDTATGSTTLPAYRLTGAQSSRCLTVAGDSQTNGTATQIWDCTTRSGQVFAPNTAGELRAYGNKCLQPRGGGTSNGTVVEISDCTGNTNQKWLLSNDGAILSAPSRLCLDVNGNATANASTVQLWSCTGSSNQKWNRTETAAISTSTTTTTSSTTTSSATTSSTTASSTTSTTGSTTTTTRGTTSTTSLSAGSGCRVSAWNTGLTENVTITNTGTDAVNGWSLAFQLPTGQVISNGWNATYAPSTGLVTATNAGYNGTLAPGGQATIGFQATHTGNAGAATGFTLNGVACTAG
jgi:hypothetical protein